MLDIYAAISNTSVVSVRCTIVQTVKLSLQFTSVLFLHCSMGKIQIFLTNSYLMQPQVVYCTQYTTQQLHYFLALSSVNVTCSVNITQYHVFVFRKWLHKSYVTVISNLSDPNNATETDELTRASSSAELE